MVINMEIIPLFLKVVVRRKLTVGEFKAVDAIGDEANLTRLML
jgi:hypothetical protein